jgi:hypothetical protein
MANNVKNAFVVLILREKHCRCNANLKLIIMKEGEEMSHCAEANVCLTLQEV